MESTNTGLQPTQDTGGLVNAGGTTSLSTMKYFYKIKNNEESKREEERMWMFDNIEDMTKESLKEIITTCGGELSTTKKMEK